MTLLTKICSVVLLSMAVNAAVIPAKTDGVAVSSEVMSNIYETVKTPFKYGVVVRGEDNKMVDSPSVFHYGDKWYMMYITFDGVGYETVVAESEDLLNWNKLGTILAFGDGTWDANQAAGYIALQAYQWNGSYELHQYDNRYWLSYLGGNSTGYESGTLKIGIASTTDPSAALPWTRFAGNPVLSPTDSDVREFEDVTLYKSHIIHDASQSLGYPFIMYYNAKGDHESIGMAVSTNMVDWQRYGSDPVVDHGSGISGDPQITKMGDLWVMFYFGAFWQPGAFDRFACSYDLVTWTKWEGDHLVESSEPWDQTYAHKPWVVVHEGIVYHFYCAVGSEGRVIALATSKDLNAIHNMSGLGRWSMEEAGEWGAGYNGDVVTDSSTPSDHKLDWYSRDGGLGYTCDEVPPAEMFAEGETGGARSFDAGRSDLGRTHGRVLFLDGSEISDHEFASVDTFTIEAFFKTSSSELQEIVSYGFYDRFALCLENGQIKFKAAGVVLTLGEAGQYCTDEWCFVAASYDTLVGTDNLVLRAFKYGDRGGIRSVTGVTSGSLGVSSRNLSIGGDNVNNLGFHGLIDEVRFSDFVRKDNELLGGPLPAVGTVFCVN